MKTFSNALIVVAVIVAATNLVSAQTQKDKEIFDYVSKRLVLPKDTKNRLRPVFFSYRKELRAAKDIYDNLKEKNITAIRKNKLSTSLATELNNARWTADTKVVETRMKYSRKFAAVLSPQQVYYLFSYANDSKEKREGKK